jgi:RNA polymerase sigma-70 factor (ECF subfamily)
MEDKLYLTDVDLVKKSLENPDNFRHIIERYSDKLIRYIKRRTRVRNHDIQDILQEIFIKIYKNLNDFDTNLAFSSWVYRIAHNYIIDWYRKEKKHDIVELDDADTKIIMTIASEDSSDYESISSEIKKEISDILEKLNPDYKEVVVLRFFEDKTYDEISDIMQIPVSLVGARLNRAKKIIKQRLLNKIN